jgi:hypothetical protein
MSDKDQVDREIREYLQKESNLTSDDKLKYLRALFEKHFEFQKLDHLLNYHDFHDIISYAKTKYLHIKTPALISNRHLYPSEVAHAAMIESILSHLNSKGLLKKVVKIHYTDER